MIGVKLGLHLGSNVPTLLHQALSAIRRNGGTLIGIPDNFAGTYIDSTGTQPVTAVGDLVGLLTDRVGTNNATQPTTASKPVVARVPKRTKGPVNLFTYSGDVSNAAWTSGKSTGATVGALTTGPDGLLSAYPVTYASVGDYLYRGIANYPAVLGNSVTFAMICNTATRAFGFGGAAPAGTDSVTTVALGGGWHLQSVVRTFTATTSSLTLQTLPGAGFGFGAGVVAYHRGALFEGAYTAQQIIDNGGIPLTTTQALPNVLEWTNAISFDGSNDFLTTGITTGNEGWICAGVTFGAPLANNETVFSNGAGSATMKGAWLVRLAGGTGSSAVRMGVGNGTALTQVTGPFGLTVLGTPRVVEGGWTADSVMVGVDGQTTTASRAGDATPAPNTPLIGGYFSGVHHLAGPMTAIIYTPVLPSAADRALIRRWIGSLQGQTL